MEQNKKVDPNTNDPFRYFSSPLSITNLIPLIFGCAISIEDSHCESFMIGECQEVQDRLSSIWQIATRIY